MTMPSFTVLLALSFSCLFCYANCTQLTISKDGNNVGLECKAGDIDGVKDIQAMEINKDGTMSPIARLTQGKQVATHTQMTDSLRVTGEINNSNPSASYLSSTLINPVTAMSGVFTCTVEYKNTAGAAKTASSSATLLLKGPKVDDLRKQMAAVHQKDNNLETTIKNNQKVIQDLQAQNSALRTSLKNNGEQITKFEKMLNNLKNTEYKTLKSSVDEMAQKITSKVSLIDENQRVIGNIQRQNKEAKSSLDQRETRITELEAETKELDKKVKLVNRLVPHCPDNSWSIPVDGRCYKVFYNGGMVWSKARDFCQQQKPNGRLAEITTRRTNEYLINSKIVRAFVWIGLNDIKREGHFVWAGGNPITKTAYFPKKDSSFNNPAQEDCYFSTYDGRWRMAYCDGTEAEFLCQVDAVYQ